MFFLVKTKLLRLFLQPFLIVVVYINNQTIKEMFRLYQLSNLFKNRFVDKTHNYDHCYLKNGIALKSGSAGVSVLLGECVIDRIIGSKASCIKQIREVAKTEIFNSYVLDDMHYSYASTHMNHEVLKPFHYGYTHWVFKNSNGDFAWIDEQEDYILRSTSKEYLKEIERLIEDEELFFFALK